MTGHSEAPCPFCSPTPERVAFDEPLVTALWDAFPVSPGHLLIVPKRHVPTWFEATHEERVAIVTALDRASELVARRHNPDGYNIGVNAGAAAGQTVFHLHVHLIPRYKGDVPDPRGGVRHVIPGKGRYPGLEPQAEDHGRSRLVEGGEGNPLRPYLGEELARAAQADIVVAFVMPSGVAALDRHLRDFLDRGGRLRLLTGDYLGLTDPDALTRLLDLPGDRQIRVFETARQTGPAWPGPPSALSFHPKAYVFRRQDGTGVAFVGSSNLSESALLTGIEWNYRTVSSAEGNAFEDVAQAFDRLFAHPATREVTPDWIERYRTRRPTQERREQLQAIELPPEPHQVPAPHAVQQEALLELERTRAEGNTAGLVVLATGLGKTWLSAFDSKRPEYRRILFVAHREEILQQSLRTFRAIRPEARLGLYTGQGRDPHADVLFASIQTLGRAAHLERFGREAFDYIVVDEFHHAAAPTYRRLIDYFRPKFLLGLTATPERSDGGDLLALCQENLVSRCDLLDGVRRVAPRC